ncbi:MAG: putative glycoside hydrolase [Elusimicrobiota bacterium]|jgi:hypothetical protein|nr:putative glycoside hydrolase [Elusimicrobiota bacterium]
MKLKVLRPKRYVAVTLSLIFMFFCTSLTISQETSSSPAVQPINQPSQNDEIISEAIADTVLSEIEVQNKSSERFIRGIHLTTLMIAAPKQRRAISFLLKTTELNTIVVDIKETDGRVYITGAPSADANKTASNMLINLPTYLKDLKDEGVYTVARLVVYRDNMIPRIKPSLAVKNPDGTLWRDNNGITWLDPYNEDAQEYILQIAERAADLGFDEIQFDYIRFPSDGNISKARYSKPHSKAAASKALVSFLQKANTRLKEKGVNISIDVFGLTTTATDDLGIGQRIGEMAEWVDYISPMVYPSHYRNGSYGIDFPNKEPYRIVYTAMKGALTKIPAEKLRPWLQDFTMQGYPYRKDQVRAQIQACYDNDIGSWLLWNPRCVYTVSALKDDQAENVYEKVSRKNSSNR